MMNTHETMTGFSFIKAMRHDRLSPLAVFRLAKQFPLVSRRPGGILSIPGHVVITGRRRFTGQHLDQRSLHGVDARAFLAWQKAEC